MTIALQLHILVFYSRSTKCFLWSYSSPPSLNSQIIPSLPNMAAPNQTCDVNTFPSFESLPIPKDIPVGGLSRRNDTLAAMQMCCSPNPVNSVGDCVLWCEIPDDMTGKEWAACTRPYIHGDHGVAYRNEGTTATSARPTVMGVTAIALLISGLFAW
ncbi:hypothetical protein F5B21DRAFT_464970 [Xylaria acuta]|nr:hypothetical protein F5B21DRAFT_464970 [Xylaria acuta]